MNGKKLIGMAVAFAVLAGFAVMQKMGGKRAHSVQSGETKTLLEGIDLNAVTGLEVVKGSNAVALVKTDGAWKVEALYSYPVNFEELAKAIRAAADVKLGKPVRSGNLNEDEFGFGQDLRRIDLKVGDTVAASIEVGARRKASDPAGWANEFFVRKAGDEAIYLVDYDFRPFSEKPGDWIGKEILNVRSADLVAVKAGDVELKVDGADWKLADLDETTEEFQSSEANKLRMALQYLNCTTIADSAKTDAELGFTNAVVYTAQTKDGFTYTATLGGEADGGRNARFAVAYSKPAAPTAPAADADQEKKDAYQKQLDAFNKTSDANQKKADALNEKIAPWTYVVSNGDAGDFIIGRKVLVKTKEQPAIEENKEPK